MRLALQTVKSITVVAVMLIAGCCRFPDGEWIGLIEMEPSSLHHGLDPFSSGEFAVLAIESGPSYRKPDCIDRHGEDDGLFPRRIDESEGGGRRPYLASYDGLARALPTDPLPVGHRVRIRGFMHVGTIGTAREDWERFYDARIERLGGGDDADHLEHVLVVKKIRLLDPPSR